MKLGNWNWLYFETTIHTNIRPVDANSQISLLSKVRRGIFLSKRYAVCSYNGIESTVRRLWISHHLVLVSFSFKVSLVIYMYQSWWLDEHPISSSIYWLSLKILSLIVLLKFGLSAKITVNIRFNKVQSYACW